ncbi:MAG TPA: sulfite reductase, partial [Cytophagales bacterium]|nr:sulfite reductase [Cytophagales bacterium]
MKKTLRKIHLYMGLISGLIVFVEAVTGCLWVFQEEIRAVTAPTPKVKPQDLLKIGPTEARELAEAIFPGQTIHGVLYDQQAEEAVHVIFYDAEPQFYAGVYLNPYTGEVIGTEDYLDSFFAFVLAGHLYLWLPPTIGVPLVWLGTILFLFIIISGFVLWWPKNKAA